MVRGPEVVAKEEQLVLDDRAADAAAVVVVRQMAERAAKVGAGIDGTVLNVLERRTMEGVSA